MSRNFSRHSRKDSRRAIRIDRRKQKAMFILSAFAAAWLAIGAVSTDARAQEPTPDYDAQAGAGTDRGPTPAASPMFSLVVYVETAGGERVELSAASGVDFAACTAAQWAIVAAGGDASCQPMRPTYALICNRCNTECPPCFRVKRDN